MTPEQILQTIDAHDWIIGPRFKPGIYRDHVPRDGWYVYASWQDSQDANYSDEPDTYALAIGVTLEEALMLALVRDQLTQSAMLSLARSKLSKTA